MRRVMALLALAGCTVESGKDVPPVVGEGAVTVDPVTQKVTLDAAKVPVVPACATGQVVRKTADGWECTAYEIPWESVTGKPTSTAWSSITGVTPATQWPGTVPLSRVESASDVIAMLAFQLGTLGAKLDAATEALALQGRHLALMDAATEALRAQALALTGRANGLDAATEALQSQAQTLASRAAKLDAATEELRQRVAVLEAVDCPSGYTRDAAVSAFTLCKKVLSSVDGSTDEVVRVGDFWIDRYEMSVCGSGSIGTSPANDTTVMSCSRSGYLPAGSMTSLQAAQMCASAGKRLCSNAQWQTAVAGTADPATGSDGTGGTCNTLSSTLRATGQGIQCRSRFGAEDMIGNAHEWVSDWLPAGAASIADGNNFSWPSGFYGDYTINLNSKAIAVYQGAHTQGLPAAVMRGGSLGSGTGGGAFYFNLQGAPSYTQTDISARCCIGHR